MHGNWAGTIGIVHHGPVLASFAQSLAALETPGPVKIHRVEGSHIAEQRNKVCREMVGGWVFFLDTDQICAPDTLMILLSRHQAIISGLIAARHSPFPPVAFCKGRQITWAEVPDQGLLEVDAVGTGCLLIHRAALTRVADPWFEVGKIHSERAGEDTYFSAKAKMAGFSLWIDCDKRIGHGTTFEIWPDPPHGVTIECPGPDPLSLELHQNVKSN